MMAQTRVLVLRAPGTNCDHETAHAFELAGAAAERIHVNRLMERPQILDEFQVLCVPGGFSYGDDIAAGKVLGNLFRIRLGDAIRQFRDRDRLILGICNGFQVLLKSGLLIERDAVLNQDRATLTFNRQGRYEDRWVRIEVRPGRCAFLSEVGYWEAPVAHAEGNFVVAEHRLLEELEAAGQIVMRYVDSEGRLAGFPANPNGAMGNVAGICDSTGRVFAMMPHPERHVRPIQHPLWTRRTTQPAEGDGLQLFRRVVAYFG
jgi:phosphoribosylformylglycinamidine synthase subunit PurQ / glutaminase